MEMEDSKVVDVSSVHSGLAQNIIDKVMQQMIIDAHEENDEPLGEPLRMLEKPLFDPNNHIEELDIADSIVLKLAYSKKHRFQTKT